MNTNIIVLTGRLVRHPQLRYTDDKARTNFTVAVDGYTDQQVAFIPITCFGKLAENVAEHTDKGHLVAVEGRITSGKYLNDNSETIYTIDIIAYRVEFLSRPRTATATSDTDNSDSTAAA